MILYYVRHGDPIYNPDGLTPLGKRQAEACAKLLCRTGLDEIYSSTSQRAIDTATPTAEILKKRSSFLILRTKDTPQSSSLSIREARASGSRIPINSKRSSARPRYILSAFSGTSIPHSRIIASARAWKEYRPRRMPFSHRSALSTIRITEDIR